METISMSRKERVRLEVFSRVRDGQLSLVKAGELLKVSYRQAKRLWSRYQEVGDKGLVHGLRGRASNRQSSTELKSQVLATYQANYADYGPTLACECLEEEHGLVVLPETLRRWLRAAGLWAPQRLRKVHRRRRPRKEQLGEMIQMDGSHHDWFEGRRGKAVLMVIVDDATGAIYARFFEEETLHAAWETFGRYIRSRGTPRAVYVDRAGIYRSDREPTGDELLAGKQPETQFGRSMSELGVQLILARSPQAKGRVERCNGTLQDRLVKALRRAGIGDLKQANRFLEETFLDRFNERFSVPAAKRGNLHRRVTAKQDLDRILAIQEERTLQHDWTIRWKNRFLQLPASVAKLIQPGDHVTVCEQLDGRLRLFRGEQELPWSDTASRPTPQRKPRAKAQGGPGSNQGQKPAAKHPWRRSYKGAPSPAAAAPGLACSAPARKLASAPQANPGAGSTTQ